MDSVVQTVMLPCQASSPAASSSANYQTTVLTTQPGLSADTAAGIDLTEDNTQADKQLFVYMIHNVVNNRRYMGVMVIGHSYVPSVIHNIAYHVHKQLLV